VQDADTLEKLYRSNEESIARVNTRLEELTAAGWLLPEYVDSALADAKAARIP